MPNTIANATLLNLNANWQSLSGSVTPTLPDFFRFNLTAPTSVNFRITGISGANVDAGIVNATGNLIRDIESRNPGFMAENINTILPAGTYYLKLYTTAGTGNYTLTYYSSSVASNDILWKSPGTDVSYWKWNGSAVTGFSALPPLGDANWRIRATGDFNNDGKREIVWQHSLTNQIAIWGMSNNGFLYGDILATVPLGFTVRGAGDFNGDGNLDLVLSDANGNVQIWYFDGKRRIDPIATEACSLNGGNWALGAVGDFNGDGKADLLWREPGGEGRLSLWFMDGAQVVGGQVIGGVADQTWQLCGSGDFNNDGKPDLLWRRSTDGQLLAWIMNGTSFVSSVAIATSTDTNWTPTAGYQRIFEAKAGGSSLTDAISLGTINSAADYGYYRGNIGSQNPADTFRFTVGSPQTVRFSIDSPANARVRLELLDSAGTVLISTDNSASIDGVLNAGGIAPPLGPGNYFLRVGCLDAQDNVYYTVNLNRDWIQYVNLQTNAVSTTLNLSGQTVVSGTNGLFYRVDLSGSGLLNVNLSGLNNDADVRVMQDRNLDAGLETVTAQKYESAANAETLRTFVEPGQYHIWVRNAGSGYNTAFNLSASFSAAAIDPLKQYFRMRFEPTFIGIPSAYKTTMIEQASWFETAIPTRTGIADNPLPLLIRNTPLNGRIAQGGPWILSQTQPNVNNIRITRGEIDMDCSQTFLMNNAYTYGRVFRHEVFHCLGLGTLWEPFTLGGQTVGFSLINRPSSTYNAPTYAGLSYGLLMNQLNWSPIPTDSVFAHWSESRFGREIMTPIASQIGQLEPTSAMTLNGLRDMGWDINLGAAETYTL
ncbi:FG-GAP-like repeat-containing protein [Leptolyngbya sp. AN03gr2]|uniref:FG-GAP-like repeat-containing protein n=1 Tax=Leptolyngbya sp. AN03gr2 TaxID=3423364 RepID=UPI003D31A3DB